MAKRKGKANYYSKKRTEPQKDGKKTNKIIPLALAGVLATGGVYMLKTDKHDTENVPSNAVALSGVEKVSSADYRLRETRTTLTGALFSGPAASAYRVAKKIPQVLDQLYCYCMCAENFGHKNLLTCYVDKHASF